MTGPARINHLGAKNAIFVFALSYLNNHLYYHNKIFITTAEFNGLSSVAYRNGILHSEHKIITKNNLM